MEGPELLEDRCDGRWRAWRRWTEDVDEVYRGTQTERVELKLPAGTVRELQRLARRESVSLSAACAFAIGFTAVARNRSRMTQVLAGDRGRRRRKGVPESPTG